MRRTILAVAGTMLLGTALHAQAPKETKRANAPAPAPASRPRVGYAGTAAPAPAPAPVVVVQPQVYYYPDGGYNAGYGAGYIVTGAPYVVLQDGSVAANFGNGYERVLRPCASANGVSQSQQDATGRDALGRILPPPGIAALQAGSRGQLGGSMPARNVAACYRTDANGRVEVVQAR